MTAAAAQLVAMVLAAGRGERMRPLTDHKPKPLLEVGHKSLIERHVEKLAYAGFERIIVNHAWLGEQIESALGDGQRWNVALRFSPEVAALETAGGIANAMQLIDATAFAVVNADVYSEYNYCQLAESVEKLRTALDKVAHLILVDNPAHNPEGDFGLEQGLVNMNPHGRLTFSGLAAYRKELFAEINPGEKKPLAPLLRSNAHGGAVTGEHFRGCWSDVGTPQRLRELDRRLCGESE